MEHNNNDAIQVTDIMEQIRAEIKEKGFSSEMLSFADVTGENDVENGGDHFDADILRQNIRYVSEHSQVSLNHTNASLGDRMVRSMIRSYIEPYAEEQNTLNAGIALVQQQVELYIQESRMFSTKALMEEIEILKQQQRNTKIIVEQLQKQVAMLSEQLAKKEQEE